MKNFIGKHDCGGRLYKVGDQCGHRSETRNPQDYWAAHCAKCGSTVAIRKPKNHGNQLDNKENDG